MAVTRCGPRSMFRTVPAAAVAGLESWSAGAGAGAGEVAASLAFFHIPLPEFGGLAPVAGRSGLFDAALAAGKARDCVCACACACLCFLCVSVCVCVRACVSVHNLRPQIEPVLVLAAVHLRPFPPRACACARAPRVCVCLRARGHARACARVRVSVLVCVR